MRKRLITSAIVGAVLLGLASLPSWSIRAQVTQCGGAFVPSLNCVIAGFWNFTKADSVSGLPTPFAIKGVTATGVTSAITNIGNTAVLALHTTPVTVVAAPGAAKFISVVAVDFSFKYTATYSAGSALKLFYGARNSGNAATASVTTAGLITGVSANAMSHVSGIPDNTNPVANTAVVLQGTTSTAFTGGDTANNLRVTVWYRVIDTGF